MPAAITKKGNRMFSTVLYFTPERYAESAVGSRFIDIVTGNWMLITERFMRDDLGDYFEIIYSPIVSL